MQSTKNSHRPGVSNFRHLLAYDPLESLFPAAPAAKDPLTVSYGADGKKGATMTQKQVMEGGAWPLMEAVLAKKRTVV